jgi:hypothetical protein
MSVNIKPYGLIALLWLCVPVLARDVVGFNPSLPAGTLCRVPIEKIHPTQFAVGYWEVNQRAADIAGQSRKKLETYLKEHVALLVVGPVVPPTWSMATTCAWPCSRPGGARQ